jgi:hypothetical protein
MVGVKIKSSEYLRGWREYYPFHLFLSLCHNKTPVALGAAAAARLTRYRELKQSGREQTCMVHN